MNSNYHFHDESFDDYFVHMKGTFSVKEGGNNDSQVDSQDY